MGDFENRLEEFRVNLAEFRKKRFKEFDEYETECCAAINGGEELTDIILANPQLCDEKSYKVLSGEDPDVSNLSENLKCLQDAKDLRAKLQTLCENPHIVKEYQEQSADYIRFSLSPQRPPGRKPPCHTA